LVLILKHSSFKKRLIIKYQNQNFAGFTQIIQNEEAIIKNDKLVLGLHAV
jgi:hypothetical protein